MEITYIGNDNKKYFRHMTGDIDERQGAIGAIVDGTPAGAGVFSIEDDIATIDCLYVEESFRRRKVAATLIGEAIETFKAAGVSTVLAYYQESAEVTLFLKSLGFTCISGDPVYSFKARNLLGTRQGLMFLKAKTPDGIVALSELKGRSRSSLIKLLEGENYDGAEVLENCDPELSYVYIKDGLPVGVITAKRRGKDFFIPFFFSDIRSNMEVFSSLVTAIMKMFYNKANVTGKIYYIGLNEKVTKMLFKILPVNRAPLSEAGTWSAIKYLIPLESEADDQ